MTLGAIASAAFEVFEDVRGAVAMYMFILEESIQTASMGCYVLYKAGQLQKAAENALWTQINLANPLYEFSKGAAANIAYPLNLSYEQFALASLNTLQFYITVYEAAQEETE